MYMRFFVLLNNGSVQLPQAQRICDKIPIFKTFLKYFKKNLESI